MNSDSASEHPDELRYHGGNIDAARRRFPDAPLPWLDLSTGINPIQYPFSDVALDAWTRLPEAAALTALEEAARSAYCANPATAIVAAPGTQALMQWLPRVAPARRVGILGFTYGEHEKTWRAAGAAVTIVATPGELTAFDVGVVVNPNNPDGRIVAAETLAATADAMAGRGGLLIIDEAFMDTLDPRCSMMHHLPHTAALVLRSFGKIYGLAGLRLGFAATAPDLAASLRGAIGPWAVCGPAIAIGQQALADTAWRDATLRRLARDASRLDALLQSAGFVVAGGTSLFRLATHSAAAWWFDRLAGFGILTRPFAANPTWLRVGIPGPARAWDRLETALRP
jgi:cobalamin biosynthetic protein CobC